MHQFLDTTGSVVTYNATFEMGVLRECAQAFPECADWVAGVEHRIIDFLEPFRSFGYYHPAQHGSASMKAVLPALTGCGYDHLDIRDDATASWEFRRAVYGNRSAEERQEIRRRLLDYCCLDTLGMIQILEALSAICKNVKANGSRTS